MAASQHVPGLLQVVCLPHPEFKKKNTRRNLGSEGSTEKHVLFLLEGKENSLKIIARGYAYVSLRVKKSVHMYNCSSGGHRILLN